MSSGRERKEDEKACATPGFPPSLRRMPSRGITRSPFLIYLLSSLLNVVVFLFSENQNQTGAHSPPGAELSPEEGRKDVSQGGPGTHLGLGSGGNRPSLKSCCSQAKARLSLAAERSSGFH